MVVHEAKVYYDGDANPGPRQLGNSIDVYFAYLVEDLKLLWIHGVKI
jgi:hypothetical protein